MGRGIGTLHFLLIGLLACTTGCKKPAVEEDTGFLRTPKGAEIVWDRSDMPFMLLIDDDAELGYGTCMATAAALWNHTIEKECIIYGGVIDIESWEPSSIGVLVMPSGDPSADPVTHYMADMDTGRILGAVIFVPANSPSSLRPRICTHELGHAIGLEHDPLLPRSVMYHLAAGDGTGQWYITEHDRLAVQSKYNPAALLLDTSTSSKPRSTNGH